LSSIASGCNHIAHVRTQLPYALLVGLVAIVIGTVPGGHGVPPWVSLLVGGVILYLVLRLRGRQADVDAAG
jgi:Na+/H+ antiporter NhaC